MNSRNRAETFEDLASATQSPSKHAHHADQDDHHHAWQWPESCKRENLQSALRKSEAEQGCQGRGSSDDSHANSATFDRFLFSSLVGGNAD